MPAFTIDNDNNITGFAQLPAGSDPAQAFASEKELASLTAEWQVSRLADIWNSFAAVAPFDDLKPVTKFKDRATGVSRIWKAIQRLIPEVAQQVAPVAKKKAVAKKPPTKATKPAVAKLGASPVREGSKKAVILELVGRKQGATLAEIMMATGWQAHSVRGFISGTLGTKMAMTVASEKREDGERVYSIAKQ
ncbi:MAG: DUF3489 domain-containing protein [Acidobacteriota bacterium]